MTVRLFRYLRWFQPAVLFALITGWCLPASGHPDHVTTAESNTIPAILKVVGDRDYPPYSYLDNGIPAGFDIDIIRAIADKLNIDIEIDLLPWAEARNKLENDEAHVISGMAQSPYRNTSFEFTTATKELSFDLFVKDGSRIRTLEQATNALIAVQRGGMMYDRINQHRTFTNIIAVTDAPQAMQMLVENKCEGAILNKTQGHYLIQSKKYDKVRHLDIEFPTYPYCLAVHKENWALLNLLNEGLNIIHADGTYRSIYDHWFGVYERNSTQKIVHFLFIASALAGIVLLLLFINNLSLNKRIQSRSSDLKQIINLIPHHIFARDHEGRYILCNENTAKAMGFSVNEILGKKHADLSNNDKETEQFLREDRDVIFSDTLLKMPETEYYDQSGKRHILQITKIPFRYRNNKPTAVLCDATDVTQLKEAEESAQKSREYLNVILNSIVDGVIAIDSSGKISFLNHVAEVLTGQSASDATGKHISDVLLCYDDDDARIDIKGFLDQALSSGEDAGLAQHLYIHTIAEGIRDITLKWSVVRDHAFTAGLVVVLRDITDERLITERLHETQKMESIGRLAGGVAHDFNNLLAGIVGYTELLSTNLTGQTENNTYLKGIFESSDRARDLIQQLLTFSRRHPSENQPVDIHEVIGHVTSLLQHTLDPRINISNELNAKACLVMGDRSQLQNAILNLGVNARDAMPHGGTLSFKSVNRVLTQSDCDRLPFDLETGVYIELSVSDTGVGIDKDTLTHIFEPFFTTRLSMGGTGLGLAAVYGTFKEHKGFINVISEPGLGSNFTLGLPVFKQKTSLIKGAKNNSDLKGSGKILIIDDEIHILKTMEAILQSLGYDTVSASNGRRALSIFSEANGMFDLVILDMIMPELTGDETYRELLKINPNVKVIVASGFLQEHNISDLLNIGIKSVIHKPFRMNELAMRVKTVILAGHGN